MSLGLNSDDVSQSRKDSAVGSELSPSLTDELDDKLGEAIEAFLELVESGQAPEPEVFAARYPEIQDDLIAALDGLALVRGLVGEAEGSGSRLETGRRIAGYRIVRELGRGGMGVVYEAVHVGLDRPVALKVLGTHAAPDSNGRRRFLNEARTAAGLHHTHIVPVFDVGQLGGLCYYAMQRIQGSGLDRVVRHLRRDRSTVGGNTTTTQPSSLRSRIARAGRFAFTPLSKTRGVQGPFEPTTLPDHSFNGNPGSFSSESATGSWHGRSGSLVDGLGGSEQALNTRKRHGSKRVARSAADIQDEGPPFTPPKGSAYYRWVAEIGREAAQALGHAHERGVIHRDIKPSNLLIDDLGKVWVADFGLARRLADPGLTQHDSLLGTPRYMSPEQGRVGPIDGRSDLYSLGATLYELLTLRPPFDGRSAAELIDQIARQEPASLRSIDPKIPRDLETIVLKLLAKNPGDRYETASDLADDLSRFLNLEPVQARRISPVGRAWRFARRHPGISSVSAIASMTVLTVTIVAFVVILNERDLAIKARKDTQKAMRTQLWREASVVRLSNVPNRRSTGLDLIRESAEMSPEPELQTKLRNEALEFLVARDVEARADLPTGKARAISFGTFGSRVATLSQTEEGASINLWDFSLRTKLHEVSLRPEPVPQGPRHGPGGPPRGGRGPDGPNAGIGGGGGSGRGRASGGLIAAVGTSFAVIGADGQSVRLIDSATGNFLDTLRFNDRRIFSLFATPDGRRLVTCDQMLSSPPTAPSGSRGKPGEPPPRQFQISLWDVESISKPLAALDSWEIDPVGPGPGQDQPLVAISPDGSTVAVARSRRTSVSLWSAEYGEALGEPIETQSELTALSLGADNQLATAGGGEVRLWDIASRTALPALTPNQSFVRFLRFSPKGSLLAVVGWLGRDVELWDTASHSVVAVLPTPDIVDDIAFSPDGQTVIASGQANVSAVWTVVETNARTRLSGFDAMTRSIAFRPDGLLALGSWKGTIRFLDAGRSVLASSATTPSEVEEEPLRDNLAARDRPVSLAFDVKGQLISLEADALRIYPAPPGCLKVEVIPLPNSDLGGFMRMGPSTLVSSGDRRAFVVNRAGDLLLWRPDVPQVLSPILQPVSGKQQEVSKGNRGRQRPNFWRALTLSTTGDRLYLIDGENDVLCWTVDPKTGQAKSDALWPSSEFATLPISLALSHDGAILAVGELSGPVTLINTADGKIRGKLDPSSDSEGAVLSLAFGPDSRQLAVGTQAGHVGIWNLSGKVPSLLARLPGHRGSITALSYDPQGRHLASCGRDKTVDVWNLDKIKDQLGRLGLPW